MTVPEGKARSWQFGRVLRDFFCCGIELGLTLLVNLRDCTRTTSSATCSAQEPWEVLSFPAIAEADEVHQIETIWGPAVLHAPAGRGLAPRSRAARNPRPYPADDRRIQFRRPVSAIARPVGRRPDQSGLVQALSRGRIAGALRPHRAELGHRQQGDRAQRFLGVHDLGRDGKDLFLLGVFRRRLEYPALKRAVREQQSLFGASVVLIEDKASGTQLIQELIADGCYGVTRYQPTGDKIMRLHAQTAMIENGFVHIPETAPWLAEYLHELTVFPNGKHDDQVDFDRAVPRLVQAAFPGPRDLRVHTGCEPSAARNHGR